MAVAQGPFVAAVLLLLSSGLHCKSPLSGCPEPCTCHRASLLNCSSSGLSLVPQHIQDSVTELDLSHNLLDSVTLDRPHHNLRTVWLGNNSITRLSLCVERKLGGRYVRNGHLLRRLRPRSRQGCVSWGPTLQLLSVERNQLEQLPEGLEGSELLQVLQLSFNRISTLRPGDLSSLRQLLELHLQHNLITSLHPQIFQDLPQLRVLDLSFNKLTSLHPLMYLSLRNIGPDVRLDGNRWQCDCSMRRLRRWMAYDSSRGLQTWKVVCATPSILSGRDLMQLEEDDLSCFSPENKPVFHQDVMVYSGSEILLSCSTQDSMLWTQTGQASVHQRQAGLLIKDIAESDTGLYVCVSEENNIVSVFNLQISKIESARRIPRSLPRTSHQIRRDPQDSQNEMGQERNQRATQPTLTLAVCLSVFITFLIAFICGVLARPCIDVLWRRVTNRKSPSVTNSVSSVEQSQYDNEAYANVEEPEATGTHRERKVTFREFRDVRDISNVQYYDTVAGINNDAMIECEAAKAQNNTHTAAESGNENSLRQSSPVENPKDGKDDSLSVVTDAEHAHNIEFEHIPDPGKLDKRRSSSSCSDSSLSDRVCNEDQMTQSDHTPPTFPQLAEDSVQQKADFCAGITAEVPQISIEASEIPGFSSEPFADWSPHKENPNLTDLVLWQENEEQFEFSDSVRSLSARSSSVCGSFNDSKLIVTPPSQEGDNMSSSSSSVSGDEPTEYTLDSSNSDSEEDLQVKLNAGSVNEGIKMNEPETLSTDLDNQGISQIKRCSDVDVPLGASDSTSSDESMDATTKHTTGQEKGDVEMAGLQSVSNDAMKQQWPSLDLDHVTPIKRCLVIRAPSPSPDSSSCSDSGNDDTTNHIGEQERRRMHIAKFPSKVSQTENDEPQTHIKSLNVKARSTDSHSSSSSDSDNERSGHMVKLRPGKADSAELAFQESQTESYDPETYCPALDLAHNTRIKKHLDIKAPSQDSDIASSSESENETGDTEKQRPGRVDTARLPLREPQTESPDPDKSWPLLDPQNTTHIKRRLDIKAVSPAADSSSSSDSEDETKGHIEKQKPGKVDNAGLPFPEPQTESPDPDKRWPAIDLEHITRIKRRLDIKAVSPAADSSSSSDSEDETKGHIEKQTPGKVDTAGLPFGEPQKESPDPNKRWPALDLEHTTRIKRRLDIKAVSPDADSSSSSDSEDGTTNQIKKQDKMETYVTSLPIKVSQTASSNPQAQWPAIDLEHTTGIKRDLDIKAPSMASDSSSSSDSEDETRGHIEKQKPGKVDNAGLPFPEPQTESPDPDKRWPAIDLEHITRIKRRLDIKAVSPAADSSSSSDSEDETKGHIEKQTPGKVDTAGLPFGEPQKESPDPNKRWPALDLEHTTRIKRRLDIKAVSPDADSSSSSDSEDGTTNQIKKQDKMETYVTSLPIKVSQTASSNPQAQWPAIDLEHTTGIKRDLDIKAPSMASDSSSSSDSEDETRGHIEKQKPGKVDTAGLPFREPQTESPDPNKRWPALDLEHITRIKRRLDIKAVSPAADSSSSSDSEDGTINQIKKQDKMEIYVTSLPIKVSQTASSNPQAQWPAIDLEHTTGIKRDLDIKAPSMASDSSSSSDSEDDTRGHIEKQKPGKVDTAGLPFLEPQTESPDPDKRWPALDLEHITRINRRLDIKAVSPAADSSSSSDSEDGTTNQIKIQDKRETYVTSLPIKVSQTASSNPQAQWPAIDLEHTTGIKRDLDIKAPSMASDSSFSSDSEDETRGHIEKQKPGKVDTAGLPFPEPQTESPDPDKRWPAIDLEHIIRIKRRLDIKAVSPAADSSSSSDSEDETKGHIEKQTPGKVDTAGLPFGQPQTESPDPDKRWPALDLEHTIRIKRRLDIKAVSPAADSSSSSDSEDETKGHIEKQTLGKVDTAGLPFGQPQTESPDPDKRWPALDLEHTIRIKRRLDIKTPSMASVSSSSSDSEDGTTNQIKIQEQRETCVTSLPIKVSQTASSNPQAQWPAIDLEHTTGIKRDLDIKAPSMASDSSSSSDSEDETRGHIEKQKPGKVDNAGLPFPEPQTESPDPDKRWPALDLEHIIRIKRRLDIKAISPAADSLLSSGSANDTLEGQRTEIIKMNPCSSSSSSNEQKESMEKVSNHPTTVEPKRDSRWPKLGLSSVAHVKRRLDITPFSPPSESSSSNNDSDSGTTDPTPQETKLPNLKTSTPLIKRHLNIKAPLQPADSCSSKSDNENSPSSHTVKCERDKGDVEITHHEQQTNLDKRSLEVPYIKRRLDIKAPSPQPGSVFGRVPPVVQQSESNSSSSDSEDENNKPHKDGGAQLGLRVSAKSKATEKEFIRFKKTKMLLRSHRPRTDDNIKLVKYIAITDDVGVTSDNINTTPEINPGLESHWAKMNFSTSRFRNRLEITSHTDETPNLSSSPLPDSPSSTSSDNRTKSKGSRTMHKRRGAGMQVSLSLEHQDDNSFKASATQPLQHLPDSSSSSSSSEKDESSTEYPSKAWRSISQQPIVTDKETSLYMGQTVNIKLDQAQSQTDSAQPHLRLSYIPHVKRALDIRAQRGASSSEDETIDHSVPDLNTGVPRVKRHLDVKAPLPGSSNSPTSSSEDEVTGYSAKQSSHVSEMAGMADYDSLITYKRVIFRPTSPPSTSCTPSGSMFDHRNQRYARAEIVNVAQEGPPHSVEGRNASLAPVRVPSVTFDDVVKKKIDQSRLTTDVDLPSESSTVTESEDKERKGLSALKVMSLERRNWDIPVENLDEDASLLLDRPQIDTSFNYPRYEEDIKPRAKQPLSHFHLSSTSVESGATDSLYGIPHYRRHDVEGVEPLQEGPPPIPATPPPDGAVGFTWRSPQRSDKQGLEGSQTHLQQSRNTDKSSTVSHNLGVYIDSPNISYV